MFKSGARYSLSAWSLRTDSWLLEVVTMAMFCDRQLPQTFPPENSTDVVENKGVVVGRTSSYVLDSSLSVPTEAHTANVNTHLSQDSHSPMSTQLKRITHQTQGPGSTSSHVALRRNCPSLNSLDVCVEPITPRVGCQCPGRLSPCHQKRSFSSMKSSIIVILHGNPQRS